MGDFFRSFIATRVVARDMVMTTFMIVLMPILVSMAMAMIMIMIMIYRIINVKRATQT